MLKKKTNFLLALILTGLLVHSIGCGDDNEGSSGITGNIKVGQLSAAIGTALVKRDVTTMSGTPTDALPSSNSFNYAVVDGIKIQVTGVDFQNGSTYTNVGDWSSSPKELQVGQGVSSAISINESVTLKPGSYTGARITYKNQASIKAFCKTQTKFLYTTATGIQSIAIGSTPSAMPSDYGYYDYAFAETTTAESPTSTTDATMAETNAPFTVADANTNQIAVLIDNSFVVSCYDGVAGSLNATGALSPFVWGNNNGYASTDFYPASSANFGMTYLPMFVWVTNDAAEAAPTSETYFVGATQAIAEAATPDLSVLGITTIAFRENGTILAMGTRVNTGGGIELSGMFDGIEKQSDNTFIFQGGGWICGDGYTNCHVIRDRVYTGFKRLTTTTTAWPVAVTAGAECGLEGYFPGHPEWGNQYRSCTIADAEIWWRKVPRN